jgi:hypothetical protein
MHTHGLFTTILLGSLGASVVRKTDLSNRKELKIVSSACRETKILRPKAILRTKERSLMTHVSCHFNGWLEFSRFPLFKCFSRFALFHYFELDFSECYQTWRSRFPLFHYFELDFFECCQTWRKSVSAHLSSK